MARRKGREPRTITEGLRLADNKWRRYTQGIIEGYSASHRGMEPPANVLATTAIMLENTERMIRRMDETTKVVNLGNFVDYGFGVITAVMPSLVANEIVSVQPLKARTGEVFFFDFKYGKNKGSVRKGQDMISSTRGPSDDFMYSSDSVDSEEIGTFAAATTDIEFTLSYVPLAPKTIEISGGDFELVDDGEGHLLVSNGTVTLASSEVDYESGSIKFKLSAGLAAETSLSAGYRFRFGDMDVNGNIPSADVDLRSLTISTVTRSLQARWMFDAAYELQNVHGISADEEIAAAMAAEIRHGIDGEIMNDLHKQAKAGNMEFTWSKTPDTGVSFSDHKETFTDLLIEMGNAIFSDTKRADGNFVIAGVNVSSLIESMPMRFTPLTDSLKAGPHVIGTLDGRWKVIKNPFYQPNEFVVGYKGTSYLEGGYVYAPFLPLFTTPAIMLDDFVSRRGIRTIYGKRCLNPHFYAKGKITP